MDGHTDWSYHYLAYHTDMVETGNYDSSDLFVMPGGSTSSQYFAYDHYTTNIPSPVDISSQSSGNDYGSIDGIANIDWAYLTPEYHDQQVTLDQQDQQALSSNSSVISTMLPPLAMPNLMAPIASNVDNVAHEDEFTSRVARLDKNHRALITYYAGNSIGQKLKVLDFVENYIKQSGGQTPMHVYTKVSSTGRQRTNAGPAKVDCTLCGFTSLTVQKTATHLLSVHVALISPGESGLFKCELPQCNATYRRMNELRKHRRTVHQILPEPRKARTASACLSCGRGRRKKTPLIPPSDLPPVPLSQTAEPDAAIAIPDLRSTAGQLSSVVVDPGIKDSTNHNGNCLTTLMETPAHDAGSL
ncbi:hypothetical protein FRC18_011897 [Serendipita sp. 400]|nr:hypothetical protein FRC18_011897 [Serendipita sp. 400]